MEDPNWQLHAAGVVEDEITFITENPQHFGCRVSPSSTIDSQYIVVEYNTILNVIRKYKARTLLSL